MLHRVALGRVVPILGDRRLDDLTVDDVNALVAELSRAGRKRETIRKSVKYLAAAKFHGARDILRVPLIGLTQLTSEGDVLHTHQHLDVFVDGKHVAVPEGIGIYESQWLTELHTHDATGVIHLESPKTGDFTLGQFFGAWGVRLTRTCVGTVCGGVTWWLNGEKQSRDPASLVLQEHQEIVVAEGRPPSRIPPTYSFPSGL